MNNLDFISKVSGLEASFRIMNKVPADLTPVWDFGDSKGTSNEISPTHTYEDSGFYYVTLTLNSSEEGVEPISYTNMVIVSEYSKTHLTDSIYNLIDSYIPADLLTTMERKDKALYITKWQLYLQPLVNHEIPVEEYSNELYYEGLENQLVMECAVYDFIYNRIISLLASTSSLLEKVPGEGSKEGATGSIKQITTGPTEVQYYDTVSESISSIYKAYSQATAKGGWLEQFQKNLCMLASRLDIYLPICTNPIHVVVPKVVNHRQPGVIGGPNPPSLVNKPGGSLI